MTSLPANAMLPLLKTAVIPIILISIFLRNRRQRRLRAAEAAQVRDQRRATRPPSRFDDAERRADVLRDQLARIEGGERFVMDNGNPVTRARIAIRLVSLDIDAGALDRAEAALTGMLDAEGGMVEGDRHAALLQLARLREGQGQRAEAQAALSEAADLHLARLRAEARGDILLLAERLASFPSQEKSAAISDPVGLGPLACLRLAGREAEALQIAGDLVARIDRALTETEGDPSGRVDGYPRDLLEDVKERLARPAGA